MGSRHLLAAAALYLRDLEDGKVLVRHAYVRTSPATASSIFSTSGSRSDGAVMIAPSRARSERAGHTLQPTALVHEAYLKLVDQRVARWENQGHFFAVAAEASWTAA